jgi:hypothetical protein
MAESGLSLEHPHHPVLQLIVNPRSLIRPARDEQLKGVIKRVPSISQGLSHRSAFRRSLPDQYP